MVSFSVIPFLIFFFFKLAKKTVMVSLMCGLLCKQKVIQKNQFMGASSVLGRLFSSSVF